MKSCVLATQQSPNWRPITVVGQNQISKGSKFGCCNNLAMHQASAKCQPTHIWSVTRLRMDLHNARATMDHSLDACISQNSGRCNNRVNAACGEKSSKSPKYTHHKLHYTFLITFSMLVYKNRPQVQLYKARYNNKLMHQHVWNWSRGGPNMHCEVIVNVQEKVEDHWLHNIFYRDYFQGGTTITDYCSALQ